MLLLVAAAWLALPYLPGGEHLVMPALVIIHLVLFLAARKGDIRIG